MSEESIYKMCAQCPWRIANHGKRTPGGFYTKKNLQRLWSQVRRGLHPQSCHMTDPSHPDHVAAGAALSAQVHECPGSVALVAREVEKLNALQGDFKAYRKETPKGLTRSGVFYWLDRYLFGGTPGRGPTIPSVESELVQEESKYGHL